MSIDYLEFKNYLEHGYEAAMHNKKKSIESIKRADNDVNGTVQRLKTAAIKDIRFYINDYNKEIESWRQKIIKAKDMLNSPAGTQAKSSYVKSYSGQPSILEEIKVLEYTMNHEIEEKEALEKKLSDIVSDKTGKKAKDWVDSHKHHLHHSSMAGMPSTVKRDQRAQIRKEIIKRIDAYENSAKFGKIRSDGSALGGKFSASNNTNMRGGGYTAKSEMRRASNKGEAADYKNRDDAYNALLSYISKVSGSAAYSGTFSKEEMELISTLRKTHPGTASNVVSKLRESLLSHDNIEHASIAGAPSRLRSKMQSAIYKKTGYQSKGSYAGAPINAKQATTDQNKAVANARFSANIKSSIEACNRDAAEAQSVYVEATTRINNIVSRNRGEVNSIIRSVNEYNENVRNIRNQTITKKSAFSTVANGKLYQGVRDEQVPVDANRQFISFSAGAQKISTDKYVYKPKMLLIDSDPGTYKEV